MARMTLKAWPNGLGITVKTNGREFNVTQERDGSFAAWRVHSGARRDDMLGRGQTWMHAVASAQYVNR